MKTFITDIIPKIQRFSKKLDDLTKLTNQHWVSLGDITKNKKVFIFRQNNQLLISENGIVEKGSWEYPINTDPKMYEDLYKSHIRIYESIEISEDDLKMFKVMKPDLQEKLTM